MLIRRVITAVILMPLVILGLFYLPLITLRFLVLFVVFLAAWEFLGLFNWHYLKRIYSLLIPVLIALFIIPALIALFIYSVFGWDAVGIIWGMGLYIFILLAIGVLWWLVAPYFLWRYEKTGRNCSIHPVFLGILIFIPCVISLLVLSRPLTFLLLTIVWSADIGAYFAGRFFGKHFLAPKISPKKTVEGVCGGVLLSLLATIAFVFLIFPHKINLNRILVLSILSVVVSLWSVIGDLLESMLKRQTGVKDSGMLLPGHGGMYDRIDSLTSAAPIFTMGFLFILTYLR